MIILEDALYDKSHKYPVYIVLMHSGTPLANAIKNVTRDTYSHACIAFDLSLDPLYSFGGKGKGEKGLGFSIMDPKDKFFTNYMASYSIYVMYVNKKAYDAMQKRLDYFKANKNNFKYDLLGLLDIYFGKNTEDHQDRYFCSRFVMEIINQGLALDKVPSLWKPQDIAELNNISCIQKGSNFYYYNIKEAQKMINKIKNGLYNPNDVSHESVGSTLEKDYEGSGDELSHYTRMKLSDAALMAYRGNYPSLRGIRINRDTSGYIWTNHAEVVAVVNVYEDDNAVKWIETFEIFGVYKGKGMSKSILNLAKNQLKATNVKISRENQIAIKALKKAGFKIYKSNDTTFFMSTTGSSNESEIYSEGYLFDSEDLYWNKDKFDNKEINLCFITGLGGSGKSTMGDYLAGNSADIEHYDLDNVLFNFRFADQELKEYGDLMYLFFKGLGKKYRKSKKELFADNAYMENIMNEFIDYAINFAKSRKKIRFVIEGVYLYWVIDPAKVEPYAVYIKGTSMIKSYKRAIKRDIGNYEDRFVKDMAHIVISRGIHRLDHQKQLNKFRKYYERKIKDKNFK